MKLIFVIPVFNELPNIRQLIEDIKLRFPFAILVFSDDGSDDETDVFFQTQNSNCIYLRNKVNEGPGAAFNLAMCYLQNKYELKDSLVITLEGDQTCNLSDLSAMIEKAGTEYSILASVYLNSKIINNISIIKQLASKMVQRIIKFKYRLPFQTYSSFYRVYQGKHIYKLIAHYGNFCSEKGFVSQLEVLLKLHHLNCALIELPTEMMSNKRVGESKMNVIKTTWAYLRFFLRFRLSN